MVSEQKKRTVQELKRLAKEYPIVGVVNLENLPAKQLQGLRASLRKIVEIKTARKRLLQLALEESGMPELKEQLRGIPALIFTKENPFTLYKAVQKNKSRAPAKAGQAAPNDIVVQAGPTPFAPGPVIGELGSIGIKTGVEGGKIVIKQDAVVCKEGEIIKPKLAEVLKRLGVEPMQIGLNIISVIENGVVFKAGQLQIDEDEFNAQLQKAITSAQNLAVEICYPTIDTIEVILQKAHREAKAVALESGIASKDTICELLGKGEREAASLKSEVEK